MYVTRSAAPPESTAGGRHRRRRRPYQNYELNGVAWYNWDGKKGWGVRAQAVLLALVGVGGQQWGNRWAAGRYGLISEWSRRKWREVAVASVWCMHGMVTSKCCVSTCSSDQVKRGRSSSSLPTCYWFNNGPGFPRAASNLTIVIWIRPPNHSSHQSI
jgi:hypothetical protein